MWGPFGAQTAEAAFRRHTGAAGGPERRFGPRDRPRRGEPALRLILVNGSLSPISETPPELMTRIAARFVAIEQQLGQSLDEIEAWSVSSEEVARLNVFVEERSAVLYRRFLRAAARTNITTFMVPRRAGPSLATILPYPAAVARLESMAPFGRDPAELQQVWLATLQALSEQVTRPLRDHAMAINHPLARVQAVTLAELHDLFLRRALRAKERLRRHMSRPGAAALDDLQGDDLRDVLALADRVVAISDAFNRGDDSCTFVQTLTSPASISTRPSQP
jgi:hypothetical protein